MKITMTKKMQHKIIAALPQTGVIDFSGLPSTVFVVTMSPSIVKEALERQVAETAGQARKLEKIRGGPVPQYRWVDK